MSDLHEPNLPLGPAQRAATFARDRGCRWPCCERRWGLELHHVTPFGDGGPTATTNGAWRCIPHHHQATKAAGR